MGICDFSLADQSMGDTKQHITKQLWMVLLPLAYVVRKCFICITHKHYRKLTLPTINYLRSCHLMVWTPAPPHPLPPQTTRSVSVPFDGLNARMVLALDQAIW